MSFTLGVIGNLSVDIGVLELNLVGKDVVVGVGRPGYGLTVVSRHPFTADIRVDLDTVCVAIIGRDSDVHV